MAGSTEIPFCHRNLSVQEAWNWAFDLAPPAFDGFPLPSAEVHHAEHQSPATPQKMDEFPKIKQGRLLMLMLLMVGEDSIWCGPSKWPRPRLQ